MNKKRYFTVIAILVMSLIMLGYWVGQLFDPTSTPPPGPKVGLWGGGGSSNSLEVRFEVGADGNVHGFRFTDEEDVNGFFSFISAPFRIPSHICTVTSDKITIKLDGTFVYAKGDNAIQGKFKKSDDTVSGSYSEIIDCQYQDNSAMVGMFGGGNWNARWLRP